MKKVFIMAALAMASLTGCDKITHDFKVENVKLNFEATTEENAAAKSAMTGTAIDVKSKFSVTREVNLAEISSSELMEYKDRISKVSAENLSLEVTFTPAGNYTIEDLILTAKGVTESLEIASYKSGEKFIPPKNLNSFTSAFFKKLISAGKLEVTVEGKTDAPKGVKVKVSYGYDLVFTAKLKSE